MLAQVAPVTTQSALVGAGVSQAACLCAVCGCLPSTCRRQGGFVNG